MSAARRVASRARCVEKNRDDALRDSRDAILQKAIDAADSNRIFDALCFEVACCVVGLDYIRAAQQKRADDDERRRRAAAEEMRVDAFSCENYKCPKCGVRRTREMPVQDRAGDEGASLRIECANGHMWVIKQ